jgi:hypothetical protein
MTGCRNEFVRAVSWQKSGIKRAVERQDKRLNLMSVLGTAWLRSESLARLYRAMRRTV